MKTETLFSVKEIASLKSVAERTVVFKAKELGITPIAKKKGTTGYLFSHYQMEEMFSKITRKQFVAQNPEIIYVTRTWIILESKINFNN